MGERARHAEVEADIERLTRWVAQRADVRALALVGSWAYGSPSEGSDVDVVLLTDTPAAYTDHEAWIEEVGGTRVVRTRRWGAITERRVALPSGTEVEFDVGLPAWASCTPVDEGTRRVVRDGMRVLHDPDGLLGALIAACGGEDPGSDDRLIAYYTEDEDEAGRLSAPYNRLELLRTQELLRQRLPAAPARVLDVGGGPGVHAAWLAADGYEVEVIDPVPRHVRQAGELSAGLDRGFSARLGDARRLDVEDDEVDCCILLGPLYHLSEARDRSAALAEAVRVTRTGGLVAAASISRYAWPLYGLRDGEPLHEAGLARTLATGRYDGEHGFTTAYSHQPDELAAELAVAGLVGVEVLGIEGPGWILFSPDLEAEREEALVAASLRVARLYDGYPDMAGASAHLLACGRVA